MNAKFEQGSSQTKVAQIDLENLSLPPRLLKKTKTIVKPKKKSYKENVSIKQKFVDLEQPSKVI